MACPWSAYAPATLSFCEARVCGWVVEPSNAWSNLAYVIVGLAILMHRRSALVGVASVLIGLGSFGLHGTGTRVGELLDVSAMYLMSALGVMFAARRIWAMRTAALALGYVALVGTSVGIMITLGNDGIVVFALELAMAVAAESWLYVRRPRATSYRAQQAMIACFVVAFTIWSLDKAGIVCDPNNHLVTGHAVWHTLTALALWFFARQQTVRPRATELT